MNVRSTSCVKVSCCWLKLPPAPTAHLPFSSRLGNGKTRALVGVDSMRGALVVRPSVVGYRIRDACETGQLLFQRAQTGEVEGLFYCA